jgi:hypothetical protein
LVLAALQQLVQLVVLMQLQAAVLEATQHLAQSHQMVAVAVDHIFLVVLLIKMELLVVLVAVAL